MQGESASLDLGSACEQFVNSKTHGKKKVRTISREHLIPFDVCKVRLKKYKVPNAMLTKPIFQKVLHAKASTAVPVSKNPSAITATNLLVTPYDMLEGSSCPILFSPN